MKRFLSILFLAISAVGLAGCALRFNAFDSSRNSSNEVQVNLWKEIASGLSYRHFKILLAHSQAKDSPKDFLVVRIDPKKFQFTIHQSESKEQASSIQAIHKEENALLSFNGAFFDKDFKPLGLLVHHGDLLFKLSSSQLMNGVFTIGSKRDAKLFKAQGFLLPENTQFALQNGPILLDENGEIQIAQDTGKKASRTILALDKEGNIVLIIVKQSLLNSENMVSLYEIAHALKESELVEFGLHSALNLDGGPSTGVALDSLYLPELSPVQNVVIVQPFDRS